MERFKKHFSVAREKQAELKKEQEEEEKRKAERLAKKKAAEAEKDKEEPKIKELTDEEAANLEKELAKVPVHCGSTSGCLSRAVAPKPFCKGLQGLCKIFFFVTSLMLLKCKKIDIW